jgi:hypothetical protein
MPRIAESVALPIAIIGHPGQGSPPERIVVPAGGYRVGEVVEPDGPTGRAFFIHPNTPGQTVAEAGDTIGAYYEFPECLCLRQPTGTFTAGQIAYWDRTLRVFMPTAAATRRACLRVRGPLPGAPRGNVPDTAYYLGRPVFVAEFIGDLHRLS